MGLVLQLLLVAVALLVTFIYFYFRKLSRYFKDRGIPYIAPIWPFGSDIKAVFLREHVALTMTELYNQLEPHKIGGYFQGILPFIVVRDPEYVQRIYTTDFSHFVDRNFIGNEESSPLEGHLFLLRGAKWRYMRAKLSPIFTSGKLKWMFDEMNKCVNKFCKHLDQSLPFGKDFDLKEDTAGFTTEVISSCAFGMESNSIGNPNSEFRAMARKVFSVSASAAIKNTLRQFFPKLFFALKIKSIDPEIDHFFMSLVTQSFEHRIKTGNVRNDFIQLLLQLREKGSVEFEDQENDEEFDKELMNTKLHSEAHKEVMEINDGVLAAQLFVFLVAGFETTSTTIYHLIYLFSMNQEAQAKAREEVRKALAKSGDYTYTMVKDLPYLNNCINETLRLFPPVPFNARFCTKEYTFPDGTKIEKGAHVILPTYALQHDPKYYPEPEEFKPERFEDEIVKGTFAPFGDGPRVCIGKRFAMVEILIAMARFVLQYQVNPASEKNDVIFEPKQFLLSIKGGIKVKVEKLQ